MEVQGNGVGQDARTPRPVRLPLTTPVKLRNGVLAVVSGHSTASCTSYRISWYDRVHLAVRHKWADRGSFEVLATKTALV